jgi:hypothetical protein
LIATDSYGKAKRLSLWADGLFVPFYLLSSSSSDCHVNIDYCGRFLLFHSRHRVLDLVKRERGREKARERETHWTRKKERRKRKRNTLHIRERERER